MSGSPHCAFAELADGSYPGTPVTWMERCVSPVETARLEIV
jgi:hypothetical protein